MTRFLLLPTVLLVACGATDQQPVGPSPTEAVTNAAPEIVPEAPMFVGVVTARNSEIIPVAFTGRIMRVDVRPGQKVRAGDNIAKLDETDLKTKIEGLKMQEKSSHAQAGAYGATASQAKKEMDAQRMLLKFGAGTRMGVSTASAQAASQGAHAGAAAAQGEVTKFDRKVYERQLSQAQIKAKSDGIVMMVKVKEGEVAQQGQPVARLYDESDLLIRFAVPKDQKHRIRKGGRVEVHIEGTQRTMWASIESFADEEAPINFTVVTADIDDKKLLPDEITLASIAHVKLADLPTKAVTKPPVKTEKKT